MVTSETWLLVLGLVGQGLFSLRMLAQWIVSERIGRSVVPRAFWWLSLGGGCALLAYATIRLDPVFMIGQASGLVVYLRNLQLGRRTAAVVPSP